MKRLLMIVGVLFGGFAFTESGMAQTKVVDGFGGCLHIPQESRQNGIPLRTWDCWTQGDHLNWEKVPLVIDLNRTAADAGLEYFWLKNKLTGKCAAVHKGKHQDGSPVVQWDCESSIHFQWATYGNQIIHRESKKCLHSASESNYAPVTIRTCTQPRASLVSANMNWVMSDMVSTNYCGDLERWGNCQPSGGCLKAARGMAGVAGLYFKNGNCVDPRQSTSVQVGAIEKGYPYGACIHPPNESTALGIQLRIWHCRPRKFHMNWRIGEPGEEDFMLMNNKTGRCADVPYGQYHDGAPVIQGGCPSPRWGWIANGTGDTKWRRYVRGQLVHKRSGKCLHRASNRRYAVLTIRTCADPSNVPDHMQWQLR